MIALIVHNAAGSEASRLSSWECISCGDASAQAGGCFGCGSVFVPSAISGDEQVEYMHEPQTGGTRAMMATTGQALASIPLSSASDLHGSQAQGSAAPGAEHERRRTRSMAAPSPPDVHTGYRMVRQRRTYSDAVAGTDGAHAADVPALALRTYSDAVAHAARVTVLALTAGVSEG